MCQIYTNQSVLDLNAYPSEVVPPTRRATIGDRAFPAAASRAWKSLPTSVREIQSLPAFRRKLKTALFAISFPAD